MNVKERLKKYIASESLSITDFEKSIDVSNGYVNSISRNMGVDKLTLIIEKYPNLNIEWLLAGKGDMLKNSIQQSPSSPGDSEAIKHLINKVADQAEEIAGLKIELRMLKKELDNTSAFPKTIMASETELKYENKE